jgi:ABC-2 type transport system permease protein
MSSSVVKQLILKDLYLHRQMLTLALVVGVLSVIGSGMSRVAFNVGSVFYLSTVIAFGVILVMYGIAQERKDKALLFVLSLPISPKQYLQAKMLSIFTIFFTPWIVLTIGAVAMILVSKVPDGMVPFLILVSTLMLMNFCVILCVALLTVNELLVTATVIITNMSVSLFFMLLGSIPEIQAHTTDDVLLWSPQFFIVLAAEIAVMIVALTLPLYFGRTRRGLI